MKLRWWGIALGLGGLLPLAGCGGRGAEPKVKANTRPKAVPVTVAPLERRPVERTVDVVGTLKGWEDVTIGAKQEGRVIKIFHDMGDRVAPGALLVELDPTDARLAVAQSERQLQAELAKLGLTELPKGDFDVSTIPPVVQAGVGLDKAKQHLARERSLLQRNAGTMQDFQNAEGDERAAEAALANAILTARSTLAGAQTYRAALDLAQHRLAETKIDAPKPSTLPDGVTGPVEYAVAKRLVAEGQMLKMGDPVAELVIENPLRLWTNVPERFSAEVQVGQEVRILVASYPDMPFEGRVTRINPAVDPVSRTFQVEAVVPNNRGMLRPGGFAEATILTDRNSEATVVPIESVVKFAGVTKLFVVEGETARAIAVETGLEGPGWVEVLGKLPARAQVVTTGQTQLADGTPVVVRTPGAPPTAEEPRPEPAAPGPAG
ncbi:MAG: efflux RND transporter periplasmic adaptor subunit [Planctomycetaceae bacterium]